MKRSHSPPFPVDIDSNEHDCGGQKDGEYDWHGHTAIHPSTWVSRTPMVTMTSGVHMTMAGWQSLATGVQGGHLSCDHPAPRTIVGCQLDSVPGASAQVRDDDVLLLRSRKRNIMLINAKF